MKIKTEILQKMISKVIQGASNNNMIPITSLIGVEVSNKKLTLMTTNGSVQFRVISDFELDATENAKDFYTIVNAEIFSKLVGKTTKEFIELNNNNNYLEIKGNGIYKLEIAINEEGEMVKFPDIIKIDAEPIAINVELLQDALNIAKASAAKTFEVPCLTGYYIDNNIIATNKQMACKLENCGLKDSEPVLLSNVMAELLLIIDGEESINLLKKDNDLIFYNSNYIIAGKELEGKELYPVKPIENLVSQTYANSIKVNKQDLLNVLDRMSLFVANYDKGGIYLTFGKAGLVVRSQKSNAEENIPITYDNEPTEFNCLIDIAMLESQIETITTDDVEIQYGQDKSLRIVNNKCLSVISFLEKTN